MKVLVIDNYDSFVFNLVHYLEALGVEVIVKRNDAFTFDEVNQFHKILLSPGPGIPDQAGKMKKLIEMYAPIKSIFGVCLGQQAIGEVFGGTLENLKQVYHGKATPITIVANDFIYNGVPNVFEVGRYHSWVVKNPLPPSLEATALDENGYIMSLRHKIYDVRGVQYHPESVMTSFGKTILKNWLEN
ncbi:anthranilate synthase component II [Capnocytophaga canimorsus]|uniref:anthranilate synthase component II n=1 Tax=Capnocytophaga canimorsus TaxID=28188 RepID=UPI00385079ED